MTQTLTAEMKRSILIATLRDETLWPTGFAWHFGNCRTCAMGLLDKTMNLGLEEKTGEGQIDEYFSQTRKTLGLSWKTTCNIFGSALDYTRWTYGITPQMVADRLETEHKRLAGLCPAEEAQCGVNTPHEAVTA